ncbi:ATP-binding protein [Halalkalibacterium ligniniphilum]|uniref:ATP-binding protein n=1 Tax=Halalkalibacterium ligniniphilum TaxID=1134413 RepID=UPI000348BEE3|nr:sensor histidine kinase [Halalkalibacterium ligniniphilum]
MGTFRQLPIRWKITGLAFGIVAFALMMIGIIILGYMSDVKEEELSQRAMITANLVAQNELVQEHLVDDIENASAKLQPLVERLRVIHSHDYIVLLNRDRIRVTHPNPERINTPFVGGDADAAFAEHVYISKAKADDVRTVRAFAPVLNQDREQIGVVVVGNVLPTLTELMLEYRQPAFLIVTLITLFGFWGSWLLASHIKKQTFEMEPNELARLLVERNATFNAIHEGVVAIDENEKITVMNEAAKAMLNVEGDVIGKRIHEVIPDTRLPEVLALGEPLYQREFYIQNRPILSNRIPIRVGERTVGAVALFQDKSEVDRLAQELTGVQAFVDALRVQNHEYSNKLHTIAGLIQLDQGKKALDYIFDVDEEYGGLSRVVMQKIHDDSIAGLLLGKVSRGKELGIKVSINKASEFINYPEGVSTHDLVVIIGNLIDNSFDALATFERSAKRVYVTIQEKEEVLHLEVSDNGDGIPEDVRKKMFTRGFSTKSTNGRGIGLFLIHSIVDRVDGSIEVISDEGEGTTFVILLPMRRRIGNGTEYHSRFTD